VSLDWGAIEEGVRDRTVLVTGGGGSIGAELCRQIARLGPKSLVVVDQSENNIYAIEMEIRKAYPDLPFTALLGDVCDQSAIEQIFQKWFPDITFHAAAYKHVPILESQIREAVRNNVFGTRSVASAAADCGCGTFVFISTDKAVNPTNIMGASKRVAEMYCQNLDGRTPGTRFITVRFGNVLDSAGSVVPLFRKQISEGGPVTVTHREVRRYFMTIPEACQLIMQAAAIGDGGEVFVLDMGEPVMITYLAEQMIRLAGKTPGEDIEIQYIGLRPGEKLFEELFHPNEALSQTKQEKIMLARFRETDREEFESCIAQLDEAVQGHDHVKAGALLAALVPEFRRETSKPVSNVIPLDQAKR
jgi:FlaA1/EpsC-like NDP-sugar epimerase